MADIYNTSLVWFRRDLRDTDHAALYHALRHSQAVYCVFIFDTEILDKLADKSDRRIEFIWESVRELKTSLQVNGGDLLVSVGKASDEIPKLAAQLKIQALYCNHDYEPSAMARDSKVAEALKKTGVTFHQHKDQVVFEGDEVLTLTGKPYSVFTPYKNAYLKKLNPFYLKAYPVEAYVQNLANSIPDNLKNEWHLPSLEDIGFHATDLKVATGMSGAETLFDDFKTRIQHYQEARNFPAIKGPSYLSTHLRFGTISIRALMRTAWQTEGEGAKTWLSELIWRDFYFQILHHRPDLAQGRAYKAEFDTLAFTNDHTLFQAWCDGQTGFPLVDAAMRQLNQTGYMHNRLRMVAASFLVKDLLIDWRWGELYFAHKLIDFDFAVNNGGWQWAASTGCDAQPYFRIFNPMTQSEKFDPKGNFIRKYVPELNGFDHKEIHAPWLSAKKSADYYPKPIVEHAIQRKLALDLYSQAK
jgi:deoxyribodipyrimidine photo-lyase